jgi:hypothetical protein
MILAELEDEPRCDRANPRSPDTLAKLAAPQWLSITQVKPTNSIQKHCEVAYYSRIP